MNTREKRLEKMCVEAPDLILPKNSSNLNSGNKTAFVNFHSSVNPLPYDAFLHNIRGLPLVGMELTNTHTHTLLAVLVSWADTQTVDSLACVSSWVCAVFCVCGVLSPCRGLCPIITPLPLSPLSPPYPHTHTHLCPLLDSASSQDCSTGTLHSLRLVR